jgi:hypothetical protein
MLPQAHTCTNTLELPDYMSALEVVEGRAEAGINDGGDGAVEQRAQRSGGGLRERCREVLQQRLEYAIRHGSGVYDLDE